MGNLRSVTLPDDRVSYQHDGRNRRIAKFIDGIVVRRWIYGDQLNPVVELDGNGAPLFRYVYAGMAHSPDYIIAANGANYRVLRDQLGSPLLIVNTINVGDVMLNASYSAFGRRTVTSSAPVVPTLGFAGGIYDEDTELTRFGARDYDGVVGRWTAKDPSLFIDGVNLYVYVRNEPVNRFDPTGRWGIPGLDTPGIPFDLPGGPTRDEHANRHQNNRCPNSPPTMCGGDTQDDFQFDETPVVGGKFRGSNGSECA